MDQRQAKQFHLRALIAAVVCGILTEAALAGVTVLSGGLPGPCTGGSFIGMIVFILHQPGFLVASCLTVCFHAPASAEIWGTLSLTSAIWSALWYLFWLRQFTRAG